MLPDYGEALRFRSRPRLVSEAAAARLLGYARDVTAPPNQPRETAR